MRNYIFTYHGQSIHHYSRFLLCISLLLVISCKNPDAIDEHTNPSNPVLRYLVPLEDRDAFLDEMVSQCRSMGISEVLLFTMISHSDYGGDAFYDGADFEKRMEHFRYCANRVREEGLVLSINAFHTLGHIRVPEEVVQHFGFERQITRDGKPNLHPVLDPASPGLRDHLVKVYTEYATLKPEHLFIDDDFKMEIAGSFHPDRVKKFAEITGCKPTLDAVASLIYSEDTEIATEMQKIMMELANRDLEDLAKLIAETVHSISPETKIGFMYAASIRNDVPRIARAFAGEHTPFVRPQMPMYREEIPVHDYPRVFWTIPYWQSRLPQNFHLFPEIENFPYTGFSKSPEATYAQIASVFGRGIGSPAYNLENFRNKSTIAFISERKGQVKKVTDLLAEQAIPEGLGVWNMFGCNLELLGLPFKAVSKSVDGDIFFGSRISVLTDEELKAVAGKGGIFDLDAMKVLKQRGMLSIMGVQELSAADRNDIINIDFQTQGRPDDWNIYYFLRNLPDPAWPARFKASDEIRLYSYKNHSNEATAAFAVKWAGHGGQRYGFINFSYDRWPLYAWLHTWMPGIVGELADWVKEGSAEVRVMDRPRVAVEMCKTDGGKVMLTLINYSTGSYEDIILSLSGTLENMKWIEITQDGKEKSCRLKRMGTFSGIESGIPMQALGVKFFVGQ